MKFVCITLTAVLALLALGQVPRIMNYQGKLTDASGVGLNGDYSIEFKIWDAETGGNLLSEETIDVSIARGLFSVQLDFGTPPRDTLRFNKPYWLEFTIEGDLLEPREKLSASGYTFRSVYADTAYYVHGVGSGALEDWEVVGDDMHSIPPGNVGIGTTTPHSSAKLEVSSIESGVLIPRMTTFDRDAIGDPAYALLIFNTTDMCFQIYNTDGTIWENLYCFGDCSPYITAHPEYKTICEGGNTLFAVNATGTGLGYQWQVDDGSGWTDIDASGTSPTYANWSTASLNVNAVSADNDGYEYRCVITGDCTPPATSNPAVLTVDVAPLPPMAAPATNVEVGGFVANWGAVDGALYYLLDVSEESDFSTFVIGYENLNVGNVTSYEIGGLESEGQYFYRVAVVTDCGMSLESNVIDVLTTDCPILEFGDFYGGGIIIHTEYSGCDCGYLVMSMEEQIDTGVVWGCSGTPVSTSLSLGHGKSNTAAIIAACFQPGIPAILCETYSGGGYTDWFLPSAVELQYICNNRDEIDAALTANDGQELTRTNHWSSSASSTEPTEAFSTSFFGTACQRYAVQRNTYRRVRALRCF